MSIFTFEHYISNLLLRTFEIPKECWQKRNFEIEEQLRSIVELTKSINTKDSNLKAKHNSRQLNMRQLSAQLDHRYLPYVVLPFWGKVWLDSTLQETLENIKKWCQQAPSAIPDASFLPSNFYTKSSIINKNMISYFQVKSRLLSPESYIHILQDNQGFMVADSPEPGLVVNDSLSSSPYAIILLDSLEAYKNSDILLSKNGVNDIILVTWYSKDGFLPDLPFEILPDRPLYYILLPWKDRRHAQLMQDIQTIADRWAEIKRTYPLKVIDCRAEYRNDTYTYLPNFCQVLPCDKVSENLFSSVRPALSELSYEAWNTKQSPKHSRLLLEHLIYSRRVSFFKCNDVNAERSVTVLLVSLASPQIHLQGFQKDTFNLISIEIIDDTVSLPTFQPQLFPQVLCLYWRVKRPPQSWRQMVMILQSWLDYGAAVVFISQTNLQEDFGSLFAHPISIQVDSGKSDKFHYQYKGEGKGSFTCRISRTAKGDKLVKEQKHPAKKRNRRSEAEHAQLRLEVARLSESGMKIGDIATELNISRSSVNNYLEKLGRTRKRVIRDVVY